MDEVQDDDANSPELFISTAKTKGESPTSKPRLVSLVDLGEFSDEENIDVDNDDDDDDDLVQVLLRNSQEYQRKKKDEDANEKEDDPMAVDEIEDVPELILKSKEAETKKDLKKKPSKRKAGDSEDFGFDDIEEDSDPSVPKGRKKKKRRTSDDHDLIKKSLEDLINDADLEGSNPEGDTTKGKNEGPIDLVNSSGSSDFQSPGIKKKPVVSIRQKAKNTLDKYRLQGGKVKIEEEGEEDGDEEGGKKARKGRKRKRLEGEYSDQEDEEDIVYKPVQAKSKLKLNKAEAGPKFDISEKSDVNVGHLTLSSEGVLPVVKVLAVVNAKLRQYQRDGVKFLFKNYSADQGAILGDEMGLGKTIQAVVFLLAVIPPKVINPFAAASSTSTEGSTSNEPPIPDHQKRPVLVCAPASVIQNWEREIATWSRLAGRTLRTIAYVGDKRKVHLPAIEAGSVNIVLTTYETFRIDFLEGTFKNLEWNCCVFDEIHKLKGRKAKVTIAANAINTRRRFGLTGTVMQNNFEELYTLLDFVRPGRLGSINYFSAKYINPIKNGQRRDASPREIADAKAATKHLNGTIKKMVLRRDKSVIGDLLKGKDDHVVFCSMTDLQINVYRRVLESEEFRILASVQEPCKCGSGYKSVKCCLDTSSFNWRKKVFPAIQNLQKLSQHPMLLHPKHDAGDDANSEEHKEREAFLKLAFGEDREAIEGLMAEGKDEELSGKIRTLLRLLPIWQEKGHKALLFSYSTRTLDILQRIIRKKGFTFSRIDGTVPAAQRQGIIDKFNDADHIEQFMMLISTKAGGLGLNITSANIVVVFDASWNVTHDLQAQDRAYRIGQTKHTDVYRLISLGTIEELIYQRQVYKQQMANIGVNGYDERRYFKGVAGVKGEEGELFGLTNLLKLNTEAILSKDLVDRAKIAEEEVFRVEKSKLTEKDEKDSEISAIFDNKNDAPPASTQVIDLDNPNPAPFIKTYSQLGEARDANEDEFHALMLASGVKYMQNHKEVIGHSAAEQIRANNASDMYKDEIGKSEKDFGSPLSPEGPTRHFTQQQLADIHEARIRADLQKQFAQFSQPSGPQRTQSNPLSNGQPRRLDSLNPRNVQGFYPNQFIPNTTPHAMNPFVQHQSQFLNTNNFGSGNLGSLSDYSLDKLTPNRSQLIDPKTGHSLSQSQSQNPLTSSGNGNFYSNPPNLSGGPPIRFIPEQYLKSKDNNSGPRGLQNQQPPPVLLSDPKANAPVIDLSDDPETPDPNPTAQPFPSPILSPIPTPNFNHLANVAPSTLVGADLHSARSFADFEALRNRTNDLVTLNAMQGLPLQPGQGQSQNQPSFNRTQSFQMPPPSQVPRTQSNTNIGLHSQRPTLQRAPSSSTQSQLPPKSAVITIDDD